ncbi:MAG: hypothetical protein HQK65_03940 [Desulfamplus sp.]|nr:hypothetical protein [Desulfamplus sp.]
METTSEPKHELSLISHKFDEVLMSHIARLIEIDSVSDSLNFNLATVACLLLIVNRENDIKNLTMSQKKRYTKESLIDDLIDYGLNVDEGVLNSYEILIQSSYIDVGVDDKLFAQIPALAMVNFLDNLFPEMPGIGLISYITQMIEEVMSGRKKLEAAIEQIDQTLLSRGVPISKQKLRSEERKKVKDFAVKIKKSPRKDDDMLLQAYRQKVSQIRSQVVSDDKKPSIITRDVFGLKTYKIKEVFQKDKEDIAAPQEQKEEYNIDAKNEQPHADVFPKDENIAAPQEQKEEYNIDAKNEQPDAVDEIIPQENIDTEYSEDNDISIIDKQEIKEENIPEIAPKEEDVVIDSQEEDFSEIEETVVDSVDENKEDVSAEEDTNKHHHPITTPTLNEIERRIAAFQQEIAISCPICSSGKITAQATEIGKNYYTCSNKSCQFISWSKPHHFECPICKNQFLIEYNDNEGNIGLKCPRATCSYLQKGVDPPVLKKVETSQEPKKIYRRVVRRKVAKRKN